MSDLLFHKKPCSECPFRKDVPVGHFPPERYQALASTAYDMSMTVFGCHKSITGKDVTCAGFLLRGATHNLSVRLHISFGQDFAELSDGGYPLFASYREMAIANGVMPSDPALKECRDR